MGIALIILSILGVVLIIVGVTIEFSNEDSSPYICGIGMGIILSILIIGTVYLSSIPPIDVYRGKTTLEITYKDNIPIDSIVVYKK